MDFTTPYGSQSDAFRRVFSLRHMPLLLDPVLQRSFRKQDVDMSFSFVSYSSGISTRIMVIGGEARDSTSATRWNFNTIMIISTASLGTKFGVCHMIPSRKIMSTCHFLSSAPWRPFAPIDLVYHHDFNMHVIWYLNYLANTSEYNCEIWSFGSGHVAIDFTAIFENDHFGNTTLR